MPRSNETPEERQEALNFVKKTTSVNDNVWDKLYRIGKGETVDLSEDVSNSSLIDTRADHPEAPANHINFESVFANLGFSPPQTKVASAPKKPSVDFGDLTPLIKEIATFKFSSARNAEIKAMQEALRKEMRTIISNRIADNTRQVSSEIRQFYRIKDAKNSGMRVEFSVLDKKYSMAALGNFRGDEYLCWNVVGNNIQGHVMRVDPESGNFYNTNDEFQIQVSNGWKE